jgi:nucleotide-binding universal stress UspA family protein
MITKILVAVDRSERNKSVFDAAVSLAQTNNATLMLLHIIAEDEPGYPVMPTYAYYPMVDDHNYELYQEKLTQYKQWGLDFLQNLTQKATELGVKTEYTQLTGNPGRIICELAKNWSADLIIVGSRGLKGLKEMFLGSVSNYITHHAPCSVLILRSSVDSAHRDLEEKVQINNQQKITTN